MAHPDPVFADANFFVALFNPADALHDRAVTVARAIEDRGTPLVISALIFLEVVTVLSQRRGRDVAVATGEYLRTNAAIEIVPIDPDLFDDAWRIFQEVEHKDVSFVDCSTIALLRADAADALLTFDDRDFRRLQKQFHFRLYAA